MTRRTFNKLLAWAGIGGFAKAAQARAFRQKVGRGVLVHESTRVYDVTGLRGPILVEGPTPQELIKSVPGVSYLRAGVDGKPGMKAYLDGVEVNRRANECDTVGGWVRMYDVNPDGSFVFTGGEWATQKNGEVSSPMQTIERIHFGKVEVR